MPVDRAGAGRREHRRRQPPPEAPVSLLEFADEGEGVRRANDTEYGLYSVAWTDILARARRVAGDLETGTVAINEFPVTFPQAPFGGYKESGTGREHGREAIYSDGNRIMEITEYFPKGLF